MTRLLDSFMLFSTRKECAERAGVPFNHVGQVLNAAKDMGWKFFSPRQRVIAMTPERIAALNYALHVLVAREPARGSVAFDCDIPALASMLAEARGEAL